MKLVVVESPSKAKTIQRYLGPGYSVRASVGHVMDLPKSKLGVDIDAGFEPTYETIRGKGKVLAELRSAARKAEIVYLAPDPDREGEAIAWHIAGELRVPRSRIKRVLFNEITQRAILAAIQRAGELDESRFNAQQARRILDRLVGYKISPLLWRRVRSGLSAGRVQTVAVRIVVEREREITGFEPREYWTIQATLRAEAREPLLVAKLVKIAGTKAQIPDGAAANEVLDSVKGGPWRVADVRHTERPQRPRPPFTTSRLQQDASRSFGMGAARTMSTAQRLYEGVALGGRGPVGLITYMRTDSIRCSPEAIAAARSHIGTAFGPRYLPQRPVSYRAKGRAQDAHEAIRPTDVSLTPQVVRRHLSADQFRLYQLIWRRFVASQMTPAIHAETTVDVMAAAEHHFEAKGSLLIFDGFRRVYTEGRRADAQAAADASELPDVAAGEALSLQALDPEQHFTKPPPRFTEATLIAEMEKRGIGRPSTYASTVSRIQSREYVVLQDKRFVPTELGLVVNDLLVQAFPKLFDIGFTAAMETELDGVEEGRTQWRTLLADFWRDLKPRLDALPAGPGDDGSPSDQAVLAVPCPLDSGGLIVRFGKKGAFAACSNYPACSFTSDFDRGSDGNITLTPGKAAETPELVGRTCSTCGRELVYRKGKYGRFVSCSGYPECKVTEQITTGVACPKCGDGKLVAKKARKGPRKGKTFYSCSRYPDCKHAQSDQPVDKPCPHCGHPSLVRSRRGRTLGPQTCPACRWSKGKGKR